MELFKKMIILVDTNYSRDRWHRSVLVTITKENLLKLTYYKLDYDTFQTIRKYKFVTLNMDKAGKLLTIDVNSEPSMDQNKIKDKENINENSVKG